MQSGITTHFTEIVVDDVNLFPGLVGQSQKFHPIKDNLYHLRKSSHHFAGIMKICFEYPLRIG